MSQVGVVKKYETVTQTDGIEKLKDKILLDITYSARQTYKRRRETYESYLLDVGLDSKNKFNNKHKILPSSGTFQKLFQISKSAFQAVLSA